MVKKLVGASVWEEALYEHLTAHEETDDQLLAEYREAADASSSPAFRFVASLIMEDHARHHRLYEELAATLKTEFELRPESSPVPPLDHWGADPDRVVELTDQLLGREHDDAKDLHRLAGELKEVKDTTLWQLLVHLMEMDTSKHVAMLDFVKAHAKHPTV